MQVAGLRTRSREEGGNPKVNFSLTVYNVALHPELMYKFQFAESLRIYQTYFLKCKDFHFFTKIRPLLHRIVTLISTSFFFFW